MLIYAVADIHADFKRLDRIAEKIKAHRPDVLVIAGDMINYIKPSSVLEYLNDLPLPVLVVRGNSDPLYVEKHFKSYSNLTSLHLNKVTIGATPFAGLSGTIPLPFRNRVCFREKTLMDKISTLIDRQTILVVHPPPWGVLDQVLGRFHSGSAMVRDLVEKTRPRILICGHIHEAAGTARIGDTVVVNCSVPKTGKGMMIEQGEQGDPVVEMV
jgi:uncharacterized protein